MYSLAPDVVLAEAEHGAVLLNERTGRYWMMNDTALLALRCVLGGGSVPQAAVMLSQRFRGTDPALAERDIRALLDRLQTTGLVAP